MDPATRHHLKGTFDAAATGYAKSRPTYPESAVAFLLGDHVDDVLDLGAGSGALTRLLHERTASVVAGEPSHNLLRELRRSSPETASAAARAELLPFHDASFDVVTVATAFHWFDPARALPEIARVLRSSGHLGLVWNTRSVTTAWESELDLLLRSAQPSSLQGDWATDAISALTSHPLFTEPTYAEFAHTQQLGRATFIELVASRSYVIALETPIRAELLDRVATLFDASADTSGYVQMSYRARCWRSPVRRR